MNPQMIQLLASLMGQTPVAAPVTAPVAAPVTAPVAAPEHQTFKVTRGVNAFKSVSKGYNAGRWMMSVGDLTTRWNSVVIPKSAFIRGKKCLVTKTQWEVTFGVTNDGRLHAISAVDTKVPTASGDSLDDIGGETLDDVTGSEDTGSEDTGTGDI